MKTVYLTFSDGIDADKTNRFIRNCQHILVNERPGRLYFLFSSWGGNINAGLTLYSYLHSLRDKVEITMHNTSNVDSIATAIFLAGHKRYSTPSGRFLFHGVNWTFGQGAFSTSYVREVLTQMEVMEESWIKILCSHTQKDPEVFRGFFTQGAQKDAAAALQLNMIEQIKDPLIPKDAPHYFLDVTG